MNSNRSAGKAAWMPDETCDDRSSPYFSAEHEILRAQIRRFVETEIKPQAQAWESAGFVPREVLRHMGKLGFLEFAIPRSTADLKWIRLRAWC